jgi:hypothetical protein
VAIFNFLKIGYSNKKHPIIAWNKQLWSVKVFVKERWGLGKKVINFFQKVFAVFPKSLTHIFN